MAVAGRGTNWEEPRGAGFRDKEEVMREGAGPSGAEGVGRALELK